MQNSALSLVVKCAAKVALCKHAHALRNDFFESVKMILLNEKKISFLIFTLNMYKILGAHYTNLTSTHNQCFKAKLNVKNMQKTETLAIRPQIQP